MIVKDSCEFCSNDFSDTVIKEFDNWTLELFKNQYYLGRCLIKLNRHKLDFFEVESNERKELFENIVPALEKSLKDLFRPDLYNYASLGNDYRHLHLHIIPRYRESRKFNGKEFEDQNWNSHYIPYPDNFEITDETFEKIRKGIKSSLD